MLTGLRNRRPLESLAAALEHDHRQLGVIVLDIDHFKRVNDVHGHSVGDSVLVEVGRRLRGAVRDGDLARVGGEEFVVVLLRRRRGRPARDRRAAAGRGRLRGRWTRRSGRSRHRVARVACSRDHHGATEFCRPPTRRCTPPSGGAATGCGCTVRWTRARPSPRSRRPSRRARGARRHGLGARRSRCGARGEAATLATRVAEHLGASAATVLRSRLAALLRDIGKVAIPDAVLAKPGPLDEAESALVRRHPIVGEELVRRIDQLADVAFVIRHHHERWDGHGYPDGLAATAIPLEARIVGAVDAWLAMRSDRAYRAKRSTASALAELRRCAGTQFDPAVVDALCAVLAPASWDAIRLPVELGV